eukprot:363308-Chlamydomonas_euryale.AAC.2
MHSRVLLLEPTGGGAGRDVFFLHLPSCMLLHAPTSSCMLLHAPTSSCMLLHGLCYCLACEPARMLGRSGMQTHRYADAWLCTLSRCMRALIRASTCTVCLLIALCASMDSRLGMHR